MAAKKTAARKTAAKKTAAKKKTPGRVATRKAAKQSAAKAAQKRVTKPVKPPRSGEPEVVYSDVRLSMRAGLLDRILSH